ncbi:MAG TPA: EAL domain-containing protein, partial [Acidimicrobiia bacterium]|nr:EAL domain-containing protein [Acidimicrobiia bacterium]
MSVAVISTVGLLMRAAAALPLFAAVIATIVALSTLAIGLVVHFRHHGRTWRGALVLLTLALVLLTLSTTWAATDADATAYPTGADWFGVAGAALAAFGMARLIRARIVGRAVDAALEGVIVAVACSYVPWAWAVSRGVGHGQAARTLVPVATWCVVVWLAARLALLGDGTPAGYRYLAAAFVCLLVAHGVLAGAVLGGGTVIRSRLAGATLWSYCLWGIAGLHPSLRQAFGPANQKRSRFGAPYLLSMVALLLVAPVTLVVLAAQHELPRIEVMIASSTIVPVLLAVYLVRQIQDRARAEYRAQHDPLTGLPNRILFVDRVDSALAHARRSGRRASVMFLDLDRFKAINDSLGHAIGNSLLQAVSKRLRATVRETDTVARMGGDEFAVVLTDVEDTEGAVAVAQKIIDAFADPYVAGGRELFTSTSIGISMYPEDGADADLLLKHADTAMYRAKAHGRNTFELYTADLSARAQVRLSLESGLRRALERQHLELHYQPRVDLLSGKVVGLEALARWPHRELGMVGPDVFVPIAEDTGLISPLGEWALDAACAQQRRWLEGGLGPRPIAVNLSARQFSQPTVVDTVAEALDRHQVPPSLLEIEITESIFMRDLGRASATLDALRAMGVRCSIDDFGTGFSGLRYLAGMSIDSLKIDQSFVSHVRRVQDDAPIIEAIIALARSLGLNVIAEGVETEGQARFLLAHGCTQMQGYLFSPALAPDEAEQLLLVDDHTTIAWLHDTIDGDRAALDALPAPVEPTAASRLLAAMCSSDDPVEIDEDELAAILAALVPAEQHGTSPSAFRAASLRLAAGTFIGFMPLSVGLASAGVLPGSSQAVAESVLGHVGFDVNGDDGGDRADLDEMKRLRTRGSEWADASDPASEDPTAEGGSASGTSTGGGSDTPSGSSASTPGGTTTPPPSGASPSTGTAPTTAAPTTAPTTSPAPTTTTTVPGTPPGQGGTPPGHGGTPPGQG